MCKQPKVKHTLFTDNMFWVTHVGLRPLSDHSVAVVLLNSGSQTQNVTAHFADIGLSGTVSVRDLWAHQDQGTASDSITRSIDSHSAVMLRPPHTSAPSELMLTL